MWESGRSCQVGRWDIDYQVYIDHITDDPKRKVTYILSTGRVTGMCIVIVIWWGEDQSRVNKNTEANKKKKIQKKIKIKIKIGLDFRKPITSCNQQTTGHWISCSRDSPPNGMACKTGVDHSLCYRASLIPAPKILRMFNPTPYDTANYCVPSILPRCFHPFSPQRGILNPSLCFTQYLWSCPHNNRVL